MSVFGQQQTLSDTQTLCKKTLQNEVKCDMILDEKSPQYMSSAELEEAIRRHREHTKKLLAEARNRRADSLKTPAGPIEKPAE